MATQAKPAQKKTKYGHLISGGVAGAVSRTATSPLERLRILQQTGVASYKGLGTIASFQQMYRVEGMKGFFKGNGITCMKIAPFSAIEFYFYEVYKNTLFPGKARNELSFMSKLLCGGLTGVTAQVMTYPLDLLKTYLTIHIESADAGKTSILEQSKIIIQNRGFRGMFQGLGMSCIGIAPFIGIKMASFDFLKQRFGPDNSSPNVVYYNLAIGASAGTIAVTMTYPTDLVRRLLQLNGSPGHNYTGIGDAISQTYAREGIPGFFKGLWATYLKVAPMTALLFLTNEQMKKMMSI